MKIIGIDDAGRGPVLGPMILAGVLIDENEEKELKSYNVKDSKLLEPKVRKEIAEKIKDRFEYSLELANPKEIDEGENLNNLEAVKTAMIINKLMKNSNEKTKVIIDCPSVNIQAWRKYLLKFIEKKEILEVICEHKADVNHPIVSAASIIAKEKREEEINKLRIILDVDFGSGYPSDPKTKEFIKENFSNEKYKEIIRFSWKTVKNLIKGEEQRKLFN